MPFLKIWLRYVWATKSRSPVLTKDIRAVLFDHMRQHAREKGIYMDCINGHLEHVHCLVSLGTQQTVDKLAQLLKGESAFWFNNKSAYKTPKLQWQDEYFCVSISESGVDKVRAYIANQESHHQKKTFQQEYEEFIGKYGFHVFG
jgi:putative transposase